MNVTVVDAGPRKISRSAEVNAPTGEIFEMVADPRRHGVHVNDERRLVRRSAAW